jgi:hypothetical protein
MKSGNQDYTDNASITVEYGRAHLTFYEDRGFGESEYRLSIGPEHFGDLVKAMLVANAAEAIRAIGNALKDGIPDPVPEGKLRGILGRSKPTPEEREF